MLFAVHLYDEPLLGAEEINNVRADRMLPTETETIETAVAQLVPEPELRVRHFSTHGLREAAVPVWNDLMVRHANPRRTGCNCWTVSFFRDLMEQTHRPPPEPLLALPRSQRFDLPARGRLRALPSDLEAPCRLALASAVSVLSSDDPVRVFQQFATLDLVSNGRAEIMAGRGSFIESFPLFGYDLNDYDALFAEKLELLLAIRESERVTWPAGHRPAIPGLGVYPRPVQEKLPIWIAVGGTPQSVVRAGTLGLPMALAIIGGEPKSFGPLVNLYRETWRRAGHDPETLQVGINSHGFVGETSGEAADTFFPPYAAVMTRIGRERGWPPTTRAYFEASRGPHGALLVGDAAEVAEKILAEHAIFGNTRFLMQMSFGTMPHEAVLKSIELFGTKVAPLVRRALS